jgi:CHAD domain-containing protein
MADMNIMFPHDNEVGPGIHPDDTIVEAASKIFRKQLSVMRSFAQGVRQDRDTEPLHKMRVAVRRMRMVYRVMGAYISIPDIDSYMKNLRKLGDTLGAVRDLDVFLMIAETHIMSLDSDGQNDYKLMMAYVEGAREDHRDELFGLLNSHWYQEFSDKFEQIDSIPQEWAIDDGENGRSNQALPVASEIIRDRYQKMLEFEPITGNEAVGRLHKLRISVKACRYSIEFFVEILGNEAGTLIETLIRIQDYLGELNDAAVACIFLENLLKDDRYLSLHQAGVITATSEYLTCLREQVKNMVTSFSSIWDSIHHPAFQEALREVINCGDMG